MATDDMKDLTALATKDDLKAFATKEDLKAFATKDDLAAFAKEIKDHVGIMVGECTDNVRKAAEGYGATLEKIQRDLSDLNSKVDTKFSDHDKILANHNERISALE